MAKIDDGGPAFPAAEYFDEKQIGEHLGMTLRDYFAAKALQGMNARDTYDPGQATPQQRAHLAYLDADAMIQARNERS